MKDPAVRKDGRCAVCEKPRGSRRGRPPVENVGTRLDRSVWTFHLERDPFCSMACCRSYYGLPMPARAMTATISNGEQEWCVDCGCELPLVGRTMAAGTRCRTCADVWKRKRKFDIPGHCVGCGAPHSNETASLNCSVCSDRVRRKWRRENDPEFIRKRQAYEAKRKAKRQQLREAA